MSKKKSAYVKQQEAIAAQKVQAELAKNTDKQLNIFNLSTLDVVTSDVDPIDNEFPDPYLEKNSKQFFSYIGRRLRFLNPTSKDFYQIGLEAIKNSVNFFRVQKIVEKYDRDGKKEKSLSWANIYCVGENASEDLTKWIEEKHSKEVAEARIFNNTYPNKKRQYPARFIRGSEQIARLYSRETSFNQNAVYLIPNGINQGTTKEEINTIHCLFIERDDERQSVEAQLKEPDELGFSCSEQIYTGGKSIHHMIDFLDPDGVPAEQAAELLQTLVRLGGYDGMTDRDLINNLKTKPFRITGSFHQGKLIKGRKSKTESLKINNAKLFQEYWDLVKEDALGEYIHIADEPLDKSGNVQWGYADVCDRSNWVKKFKPYKSLEQRKTEKEEQNKKREIKNEEIKITAQNFDRESLNESDKVLSIVRFLKSEKIRQNLLEGTKDGLGLGRSHKMATAIACDLIETEKAILSLGLEVTKTARQLFEEWLQKTFNPSERTHVQSANTAWENAQNKEADKHQVNYIKSILLNQYLADDISDTKPNKKVLPNVILPNVYFFACSDEDSLANPNVNTKPDSVREGEKVYLGTIKDDRSIPFIICQNPEDALNLTCIGYYAIAYPALKLINGQLPKELQEIQPRKVYLIPNKFSEDHYKEARQHNDAWESIGDRLCKMLGKDEKTRERHLRVVTWTEEFKSVSDLIDNCGKEALHDYVASAISFRRWQARHQMAFYAHVDAKVNVKYLNDARIQIPQDVNKIMIKGGQETGKTVFLKGLINEFNNKGCFTLIISHRIQLSGDLAKSLGEEKPLARIGFDDEDYMLDSKSAIVVFDSILKMRQFILKNEITDFQLILDEFTQVDKHFLMSSTEIRKKRKQAGEAFQEILNMASRVIVADADLRTQDKEYLDGIKIGKTFVIHNTYQKKGRKVKMFVGGNQGAMLQDVYNACEKIEKDKLSGLPTKQIWISCQAQKAKSTWGTKNLFADLSNKYPKLKILVISSATLRLKGHPAKEILEDINERIKHYDIVITSPSIDTGVSIKFDEKFKHNFGYVFAFCQGVLTPTESIQQFSRVRGDDVERSIWIGQLPTAKKHGGATVSDQILNNLDYEMQANINALSKTIKEDKEEKQTSLTVAKTNLNNVMNALQLGNIGTIPVGMSFTNIKNFDEVKIYKHRYAVQAALHNLSSTYSREWCEEKLESLGYDIEIIELDEEGRKINKKIKDNLKELKEEKYQEHLEQVEQASTISDEELEYLENNEECPQLSSEQFLQVEKANFNKAVGGKIEATATNLEWSDKGGIKKMNTLMDLIFYDNYYKEWQALRLEGSSKNKRIFSPDTIKRLSISKIDFLSSSGILECIFQLSNLQKLLKMTIFGDQIADFDLYYKERSVKQSPQDLDNSLIVFEGDVAIFTFQYESIKTVCDFIRQRSFDADKLLNIKSAETKGNSALFKSLLKLLGMELQQVESKRTKKVRYYRITDLDHKFVSLFNLAREKRSREFIDIYMKLEEMRFNKHECLTSWAECAIAGVKSDNEKANIETIADLVREGADYLSKAENQYQQSNPVDIEVEPLQHKIPFPSKPYQTAQGKIAFNFVEVTEEAISPVEVEEHVDPLEEILKRGLGMIYGSEIVEVLGMTYNNERVQVKTAKGKLLTMLPSEIKPLNPQYLAQRYQKLLSLDAARANKALEDLRKVADDVAQKIDLLVKVS
ncbi:hypothetical protein H6H01_01870 [Nostoc calcicola FACHB-3891]|nr:hypothetical protein [Nostoc calcicola FACHB-3891]